MILDHAGFSISKYEECKAFYRAALAPLGISTVVEFEQFDTIGFGKDSKPDFWLYKGEQTTPKLHFAFRAENKQQVDDFYTAALAAGGSDNGKPGLREKYHKNYYGAFVSGPDGHNIEAVYHGDEALEFSWTK